MRYRKKPVVIEAIQWKGDNWEELEEFGSERDTAKLQGKDYYKRY